jgi:hypothetical protein
MVQLLKAQKAVSRKAAKPQRKAKAFVEEAFPLRLCGFARDRCSSFAFTPPPACAA